MCSLERCGPNRLRSGIKKCKKPTVLIWWKIIQVNTFTELNNIVFWLSVISLTDEVYLTFDEKTAHRKFAFENGRKVKTIDLSKKAARGTASVNKDMVRWTQVFCERPEMPNRGLTGLCYWEMEWTGQVAISLAYEKVGRDMSHFGSLICSKISWSLSCSHKNYTARHGNTSVTIETEPCPRIGVFLDYDNGLLSFYSVTPGQLSHIYTFNEKFTRPLFPGFSFKKGCVSLCDIDWILHWISDHFKELQKQKMLYSLDIRWCLNKVRIAQC